MNSNIRSKWSTILAAAILIPLVLAGCGPAGVPTCATSALLAPVQTGPAMWEIVSSLSPTLSWTYPDATCNPQGYAIGLRTGPLFTDSLGGGTGNPSTSWGPGSPLAPGKEYAWTVRAINDTTLGPIAGNDYFFTGPMCATADLQAPNLLEPAAGAVITDLNPTLIWQYPQPCLPQGYRIDLSVDATFADTSLAGGTGNPSTRWGPGQPLDDCMVYFWKVAPINDITLGPASEMSWFTTDVHGTCPTPTPMGASPTPVGPTPTLVGVATFTPTWVGPTPTPTAVGPTDTPTQVPGFTFTPNINANCRLGPGTLYGPVGVAMSGIPYLLDGRNADASWLRLMLSPNAGCWVPAGSGTPSDDPFKLRVLVIPTLIPSDTPTQVGVNCSSYTDQRSCVAQPVCKWVPAITHAGDCVNK
jgi:hypothetical protein